MLLVRSLGAALGKYTLMIMVLFFSITAVFSAHASEKWKGYMPPVMSGAEVHHQEVAEFGRYDLVAGPVHSHTDKAGNRIAEIQDIMEVEGRISQTLYRGGEGNSPYQVYRYYRIWLEQAGFTEIFSCSPENAGSRFVNQWYGKNPFESDYGFRNSGPITGARFHHYITAKKETEQGTVYVSVMITQGGAVGWPQPGFRVDVVEETGFEVVVGEATGGFESELKEKGFSAFYGILFDSGKFRVKAESSETIGKIARYLKQNSSERFYVVGHTDGVGKLDFNIRLSENRAKAVVDELVRSGIEAGRMIPKGVGPLAPVATNEIPEGRAKNRRVELVRITPSSDGTL
ncbi:OmpA family protein [Desulfobotulus sp. H1]|uniref:OmpA family protein n=1 Tax=Desulfobotulus pelophilus TaxID=2823377 RepID=A0ABT3NAW2_9BACT|nr:OmpA family protein [Desulfobotulus pelophilus]MCW7754306.1 OmpA family protein [Desulfobotulus pelophilus]